MSGTEDQSTLSRNGFNGDVLEVLLKCDSTFAGKKNLKISLYSFIFYLKKIYVILICIYCL